MSDAEQQTGIEAVKQILSDNAEPGEATDTGGGDEPQAEPDGGTDSGPGELDEQEPDPIQGMEAPAEEDPEEDPDGDPVTIRELADQLSLDPSELYDVEIPLGKGESVTLGEMKDAFKEYGPLVEARETLDRERDEYQRSIMQTRAELNGILAVIPPELRQAVVANGQQYNANWETQQREQVLEAIPEWKDPDNLAKDRDAIVNVGAEYGFSAAEMQYTQDSRTLRMLRDFSRMKSQLADMQTAAKRTRGKPNAPGKQNTRKLTKRRLNEALGRAKQSSDMSDKRKAVSYLIGNQ